MTEITSMHAEASLNRRMVLFAKQLETCAPSRRLCLSAVQRGGYSGFNRPPRTQPCQKRLIANPALIGPPPEREGLAKSRILFFASPVSTKYGWRLNGSPQLPSELLYALTDHICICAKKFSNFRKGPATAFVSVALTTNGQKKPISLPSKFVNSVGNDLTRDACNLRPLGSRLLTSVDTQNPTRPGVSCLLFCARPSTVFRRVALAVVNSFKAVRRAWLSAHISQKLDKRVLPLFADADSAPPVTWPRRVFFITAPTAHAVPCCVFRGVSHTVKLS